MCGICGTKGFKVDRFQETCHQMLDSLRHRGPDENGQYLALEDELFLGATRLSIMDLTPQGSQPLFNEDQTIILVCNGEIYNAPALRNELLKKQHRFRSKTDSEVIIHLYEETGEDCLLRIKGMFAFALWDKRKKVLFIGRDRIGIKPLYYFNKNGKFAFASEIKALLKLPFIEKEMDLEALDLYFSLEYVPSPLSIFKNIRKLEPGTYLLLNSEELQKKSYWDLKDSKSARAITFKEASGRLEVLLSESVKEHLNSDVPVGLFLSGGLDSGVLAALVKKHLPVRMRTFSLGFEEKSFDETKHSQMIARLLGSRHQHCIFKRQDFIDSFSQVTNNLDEPLGDFSVFPLYFLARFARHEVKTAISGEGGDELFMGYPTYRAHKLLDRIKQIPEVGITRILKAVAPVFPNSSDYFTLGFKVRQFLRGEGHFRDPVARHLCWMGSFLKPEKTLLYSEQLTNDLAGFSANIFNREKNNSLSSIEGLKKVQYQDFYGYLSENLLVKADRVSMAASLELRLPYLDHEIMEFAWGLPSDFLFQKRILRTVAGRFLPHQILGRKKQGFAMPLSKWLKEKKVSSLIEKSFDEAFLRKQGLFKAWYVRRMLDEHIHEKNDHRKKLGTYFMFQAWYNRFFS